MMDGEKRIVTFMGNCGRKISTITYRQKLNLFEVLTEDSNVVKRDSRFFRNECDAQAWAEYFAFGEKYANE